MSDSESKAAESVQQQQQQQGDPPADLAASDDKAARQNGDNNGQERNVDTDASTQSNIVDDDKKLFIGGISWETTEKELKEYFGKYGNISTVSIKTDPSTGRSRGFAFVIFDSADSVKKVLETTEHTINNKKVEAKRAKSRPGKVFVGGLKPEISDDDIREHFAKFGVVSELELPQDKAKGQRKNFCFVTFEQMSVVQELVRSGKTTINGVELDVKRATPKGEPNSRGGMSQRGTFSGRSGFGGFGGYGGGGGYDAYAAYGGYGGYPGYAGYGYGNYYGGGYAGYGGYGSYPGYTGGKMRGGSSRGGRYQPY